MRFSKKQIRIICIVIAVAMIFTIGISIFASLSSLA